MITATWLLSTICLVALIACLDSVAASVERDSYGVPHIKANTDERAMYEVGRAQFQDRGYQMLVHRLAARGRLAEFFGPGPNEVNKKSDITVRVLGWTRYATKVAKALPAKDRLLVSAFAQGVSAELAQASSGGSLPTLAKKYLGRSAFGNWTVEDCLLAWLQFANYFAPDGLHKAATLRDLEQAAAKVGWERALADRAEKAKRVIDPDGISVEDVDVPEAWRKEVEEFAAKHFPSGANAAQSSLLDGMVTPKFSHAWAVGAKGLQPGQGNVSVLHGDPQIPLQLPGYLHEWHAAGSTFEVRGAGVVGTPMVLVGSGGHVAWSVTALAMDQTDLFKLTTNAQKGSRYFLDGQWRDLEVDDVEHIEVKGEETLSIPYRETIWGPVVTAAMSNSYDAQWSLKSLPLANPGQHTVSALFALYRADNVDAGLDAMSSWDFPSCNLIISDDAGLVGYRQNGAIPVRSKALPLGGVTAWYGNESRFDWPQDPMVVPPHLNARVSGPKSGYVLSGNNRPIGAWYPIPLLNVDPGDSARSRRVRELLSQSAGSRTVLSVHEMHYDTVSVELRDITKLAIAALSRGLLSAPAAAVATSLQQWSANGHGAMDANHTAVAEPYAMSTMFRHTGITTYGSGPCGLQYMLRTIVPQCPSNCSDPLLVNWLDAALSKANSTLKHVSDQQQWLHNKFTLQLKHFQYSIGQKFDFDPTGGTWLNVSKLVDPYKATILSQNGQSYSQTVVLGDPSSAGAAALAQKVGLPSVTAPFALSVLPMGVSEDAASPHFKDQLEVWRSGALGMKPSLYFPAQQDLQEMHV